MRVQIYHEELILGRDGVELVEQVSRNGERFFGLRVWLETPQTLLSHSTPGDDDRSAVTFWTADKAHLYALAGRMRDALKLP